MKKFIPNSIIIQVLYILFTLFIIWIIASNLKGFLPAFLAAFCLYVLLQYPFRWLAKHTKMKSGLISFIVILGTILILVVPSAFVIEYVTGQISKILTNKQDIEANIKNFIYHFENSANINLFDEKYLGDAAKYGVIALQKVMNTTFNSITQIGLAFFILAFALPNYKKIQATLLNNLPFKRENLQIIDKELNSMVISSAIGVPLVSLLQAFVGYIGFIIFKLPDPFTWFILMFFAGMVPMVGTALVYVPAVVYMFSTGNTHSAIGLLVYCLLIVGSVDNIFRFLLNKKIGNIPPLISVFGVIVGLNLFGFIGIIFGPILLSSVFWLIKLYQLEFTNKPKAISALESTDTPSKLN